MDEDNSPVEATEDTGLSEEAQTSTDDDVAMEDMEFTEEQLIGDDDSDTEENEAATESTEVEQSTEEDGAEEQSEAEESDKPDTAPINIEAERKRFNDDMAKQRIAEREAREEARKAKEALEAEHLRNYLAEAEGDDQELAARQLNVEAYRLQQEKSNLIQDRLAVDVDKAVSSIDLFQSGTPAEKKALLKAVETFEAMHVKKDERGNLLSVDGNLYQYLQKEADSIRELTQSGAVKEAKTKESAKARTITPPTRAPKQKVDKDLDDFDRAFGL